MSQTWECAFKSIENKSVRQNWESTPHNVLDKYHTQHLFLIGKYGGLRVWLRTFPILACMGMDRLRYQSYKNENTETIYENKILKVKKEKPFKKCWGIKREKIRKLEVK